MHVDLELTATDRRDFEKRGYLVLPSLFAGSDFAELRAGVDEVQGSPEVPGEVMRYYEVAAAAKERLLNRIENFVSTNARLARAIQGSRLLGVASQLFGEPAVLFKDKINLKLPRGGGFEAHQDAQAGWDQYASYFITAAVALDEATPANGCLELARWAHRRKLIGPIWQALGEAELRGISFEPLSMKAGDAVFFDSFLPHRSAPNYSDLSRLVLYVTYNAQSAGDHWRQYFTDKRASYPPDCEREPGREYVYRV